jgi:response regulator RpfG family c-di-GMP phosphodiesterase
VLPKILFVDDEENILMAFTRGLRKQFNVETALGGEIALKLLEESGPYAVIVSDMRMPRMDGVELLALVKERYPDTVRIMLTGNSDQSTAQRAVNRGAIFRFLTKPCDTETLAAVLEIALAQYRLITAEKVLLEKTLRGTIHMLVELLSLLDPVSFGRSQRIGELSERTATKMGMEETWGLGVAAVLSHIGILTIPPSLISKVHGGAFLNSSEREIFDRVPEIGATLIRSIPRLEEVAHIVYYSHKNYNGSGFPPGELSGDAIPQGARILRAVSDFMDLVHKKSTPRAAVLDMFSRTAWYDIEVLQALKKVVEEEEQEEVAEPREVRFEELRPGMTLMAGVETLDGWLVLPQGTMLRASHFEKLKNFRRLFGIREPLVIIESS